MVTLYTGPKSKLFNGRKVLIFFLKSARRALLDSKCRILKSKPPRSSMDVQTGARTHINGTQIT